MTKNELDEYETYLENIATNESIIESTKEKSRKEGLKEGEKNKALAIAKNMKLANMPNETITQMTGLSIQEIKNI